MREIWKSIPGYNGIYYASNTGRLKTFNNYRKCDYGRILKQAINKKGYCQVSLSYKSKKQNHLVHRLIAITFLGMPPKGKQVAHNDGVRTNNAINNLRYATPKENIGDDRERHGKTIKGTKQHSAKINEHIVGIIYKLRNSGVSSIEIGLITDLSSTHIQRIWKKQAWKHIL